MEKELKSAGSCIYCNQLFSQKEMARHLASHLTEKQKACKEKASLNYCHIEVESDEMFLHLLVKGDAQMRAIDQFLKDIWLDCCGHLSAFGHKNFKIKMKDLVEEVMEPRIKIYHDYDFGSTTTVFLKGHKHYLLNEKKEVILLSRNEPFKINCSLCKKKPAIYLCTECFNENEDDYTYYCEKCAAIHEDDCDAFSDYSKMPVVNSPRMGVCGYEGGHIDQDRDRIH